MDKSDRTVELNMAPEGKTKTALFSCGLGVVVSVVCYLIARKVTDSTLDGVEVLLTECYDVEPKEDKGES